MTSIRLAHSRFMKSEPAFCKDIFDKIVTSVWSFDPETKILTYGATVFRKSTKNDFWNKRQHKNRALERFEQNPIRVKLCVQNGVHASELQSSAIDWFISSHLIYKFGTHNKNAPDVRRVHFETKVRPDFNSFYDPTCSEDYVLGGPRGYQECPDPQFPFFLTICAILVCSSASFYVNNCL
jgi:hypothetical protein